MTLSRQGPSASAPAASSVGPNAAKSGAAVSGVFLQTSTYATPIPIVYGSARVAPNVLHLANLHPLKSKKKATKSGAPQDQSADMILGLCEGPIAGLGVVWKDRNEPLLFSAFEPGAWSLFLGTLSQAFWSHLPAGQQVPYQFVAYMAGAGVTLPSGSPSAYSVFVQGFLPFGGTFRNSDAGTVVGSAGSLGAFNSTLTEADDYFDSGTVLFTSGALNGQGFPVARSLHASGQVQVLLPFPSAPVNGDAFLIIPNGDASPADILLDLLTNVEYGVGLPAGYIASLATFTQYCAAAGLFMSPVYDTQRTAAETITELLQIANSAMVWSDGQIKVIPYGDLALTGNGQTFTPNTTPVYALTDTDFLGSPGEDPIQVTRKRPSEAYNRVTVTFEDNSASSGSASSVAQAQDLASIEAYGVRDKTPLDLRPIRSAVVAQTAAQLILQRELAVRNTYVFTVGWARGALLEPMDLLELNDQGLGLVNLPVRVTEVNELENDAGFEVTCEDWPDGTATAVAFPTQAGAGYQPNNTIDPGNTVSPAIFEGPVPLIAAPLEIWIGASGGPNWGGCDVWMSTDNVTYTKVGSLVAKATFGVTTAGLAANAALPAIDISHTLSVDLTPSEGALLSASASDFAALVPLCYVDGEFLAYENATLTSAEHYDLMTLGRGAYGSGSGAHLTNKPFVLCDQALLRLQWPKGLIGQTLYFKFPAFNIFGLALQDLATVTPVVHVIGQGPNVSEAALSIEVTQTASSGAGPSPTATFNVVVRDPGGGSGLATVFVAFQGLQGVLDNTTGLPVASSFAATIGTTYSFTATLNQAFRGGGAVKFHAAAAGRFDAYAAWYSAAASQDANPDVVIAIGNNNTATDPTAKASAVVNAPDNIASIKWLASTSAYPAQSTVVSSGTSVSGGTPFAIADLGVSLNLGNTVFLTVITIDTFGTVTGQFFNAKATRANILAQKTMTFGATQLNPHSSNAARDQFTISGSRPQLNPDPPTGSAISGQWALNVPLPDNCTITGFSQDIFCDAANANGSVSLFKNGAASAIGSVSAANTGAFATYTVTGLSELTTGNGYYLLDGFTAFSPATNANIAFASMTVTYVSATTQATL